MIDSIKDLFKRYQVLIYNFSYLSALQLFSIIVPLVTYPYLIGVLGSERYGMIVYSEAVIGYLVVFIAFGFNITATKDVSIFRNDIDKLNEIFSSVFIIKGTFFIISFFLLFIVLLFIPIEREFKFLFYLTMWKGLYEVVFPMFYFQGVEKMKYITVLTLLSRLLFLGLIFIFIKTKADFLLVPVISGIGAFISGVIAFLLLKRNGISLHWQPFTLLVSYVKNSYIMALAYASNVFKTNFNLLVLKFLFSYSEVAYFDLALKITNIGNTFLDLVSRTIFPKMSREKNTLFLRKIIKLSVLGSLGYVLFIQLFAGIIIDLLGGYEMFGAIELLRLLVFYLPIYIIGALLGRNCLIVHNQDKFVLLSMFYSSLYYLLAIAFCLVLKLNVSPIGLVFVFLSSFLIDTMYRYVICKKLKLI
jgi:PST family polysaccharide transporter